MAKRWIVCPILPPDETDPSYRVKVHGMVPRYEAIIPTDPVTGIPRFNWGLALVDASDFSAIDADQSQVGLPVLALDATLGQTFTNAQLNNLKTRLEGRGIDLTGLTRNSTLRQLVRRIGQRLESSFDENRVRG